MNKKTLTFLAVAIIIIILIILGIKSCSPRTKPTEEGSGTQTEAAATDANTQTPADNTQTTDTTPAPASDLDKYRNNFINANTEFTCLLMKNPGMSKDKTTVEKNVREVFAKHTLPVDDNPTMVAILQKYENDTEVAQIIKDNSKPCRAGEAAIYLP